jgi:heat shock protein HslJ
MRRPSPRPAFRMCLVTRWRAGLFALSLMILGWSSPSMAATSGGFEDLQWKLTKYAVDGRLKEVPASAKFFAEFRGGTLSGRAVNTYSAPYKIEGDGRLSIGKMAATLMAGPPELQEIESAYFAALAKVASYASDGSTLTLHDGGGTPILAFSRSQVGLVGAWKVTAYNNGKQAVVGIISTTTITMSFTENGKVEGHAGVNRYHAEYTTNGTNGIAIGAAVTTRMAGPAEAMEQEQKFLAALLASNAYQLRGETLELRDGSGALQVSAELAVETNPQN